MSDDATTPQQPIADGEPTDPGLVVPVPPVPPPFQYGQSADEPLQVVEQTPVVSPPAEPLGAAPMPTEPLPTEPLPTMATPTEQLPSMVPPPPVTPMSAPGGHGAVNQPATGASAPAASSGKGKRIGIMAGAAVAALALGAGGGYLARGGEVDDLTSERDELIIERNDLSAERTSLTEERDKLDADLTASTAEREALEAEMASMTEELTELETQLATAGEGVGACKDAADMADSIGDQWLTIWTLQNDWFETEVGSPEEAALDTEIDEAFDKLDELYFDLDDLRDACDDAT